MTDAERQHLRQLQKQQRDDGYVKVTVLLMLDAGWGAGQVAQALGLDDGTGYRYVRAWQRLGLEKYLVHAATTYWGLLPSAGLAALSREVEQTLYTGVRALIGATSLTNKQVTPAGDGYWMRQRGRRTALRRGRSPAGAW